MTEASWTATIDKHASEADLALGKLGDKFLITVGKEVLTVKPLGYCMGEPYVLPLLQVCLPVEQTCNPFNTRRVHAYAKRFESLPEEKQVPDIYVGVWKDIPFPKIKMLGWVI